MVSIERLKEVLDYDPETGKFFWKIRPSRRSYPKTGDEAGSFKNANQARYIRVDYTDFTARQLAWLFTYGEWPKKKLQPIDDDKDNNRISNLREMPDVPERKGSFDHSTPEGRAAYCRAHRSANPDHYKNKELKKTFGIDLSDYKKMLVDQKGVCAICGQPETTTFKGKIRQLAVDHDHETGVVRELLCQECNIAIGKMREDPDIFRNAIAYIERHKKKNDNVVPFRKEEK